MSDYAYISERAKKTFASLAKLEGMMQREPSNKAVETNLIGMRRKAAVEREEMERLAAINQIEVCQYRMIPVEQGDYSLGNVARSLLEYQNMFSQIYDSFKNGLKSKAIIGKDAALESSLDFAYSYSGSLGVVLLARSERNFIEGNLDQTISVLYDILDMEDADAVRDIAHVRGRAVIKRVHDWSKANVEGGFSADIRWKRSDGKQLGQVIDKSQMEKIVEFIEAAPDETTETVNVRGMLVAVSLPNKSFQIVVPDSESYSGHFSEDVSLPELTVGHLYDAQIEISETTYYATEQIKKTNVLTKIDGPIVFP